MRYMIFFFCLCLLLGSCTAPKQINITVPTTAEPTEPSTNEASSIPTIEETTAPTTQPVPETTVWVFDPMDIVSGMTQEEKVGQLFLARCSEETAIADILAFQPGGYILFAADFEGETVESVRAKLADYQASAKIPMLLAVDEEGGTVTRISRFTAFREKRFSSPRKLYQQGGMEAALAGETEKAQLLTGLGINVNMAPVCDVTTDPNAFMYHRSLGQDAAVTADYIRGAVRVMSDMGLGSVLKHFPGYGNNTDTHSGIAYDSRSLEQLEQTDLLPFAAGIEAGCGAVLVSHTIVSCLDSELPASLSPAVHAYLRDVMGFTGVIVTDDLVMQAISDVYGAEEAAVLAVLAGNDLLCSSELSVQYNAVLTAVRDGRIPEALLEEAVCRVITWKYHLGLLDI